MRGARDLNPSGDLNSQYQELDQMVALVQQRWDFVAKRLPPTIVSAALESRALPGATSSRSDSILDVLTGVRSMSARFALSHFQPIAAPALFTTQNSIGVKASGIAPLW